MKQNQFDLKSTGVVRQLCHHDAHGADREDVKGEQPFRENSICTDRKVPAKEKKLV